MGDLSRVFCEAAQSTCERTLRRSELQRRSALGHLAKVPASSQSMAGIPKMVAVGWFGHQQCSARGQQHRAVCFLNRSITICVRAYLVWPRANVLACSNPIADIP